MDRITLSRVTAWGRHGADPGERSGRQPFHIDLVLDIDLTLPAATDLLQDTVNYAQLYREIVTIVEKHSYELLERLAAEIVRVSMDDPRIVRATVTVAKPQLLDGATPSVTLVRER